MWADNFSWDYLKLLYNKDVQYKGTVNKNDSYTIGKCKK